MKKLILIIAVLFVSMGLFITTNVLSAEDSPDEIVIDTEGYSRDRKGPVPFSHALHSEEYGVACNECHHEYVDGENVWEEGDPVKKCIECHDPEKSEGDVKRLQTAFHDNCKNCHKEAGGDAPARRCNDCHSRD